MREKNIKVTKNDIYSPTKVQVEVPVEKNQNCYKQLNKHLICDNFIPDKNLRNKGTKKKWQINSHRQRQKEHLKHVRMEKPLVYMV